MTFAQSVRTCFRKYVSFRGRASRSEYWWFTLFLFLGSIVASALDGLVGANAASGGPVAALFSLATFLPAIAAGWRRMHDTGRSGLYLFYPVIVMVGIVLFLGVFGNLGPFVAGDPGTLAGGAAAIVLWVAFGVLVLSPFLVIWWLTRPSQPAPNAYGPSPPNVAR